MVKVSAEPNVHSIQILHHHWDGGRGVAHLKKYFYYNIHLFLLNLRGPSKAGLEVFHLVLSPTI